jgi:hypothetical protein
MGFIPSSASTSCAASIGAFSPAASASAMMWLLLVIVLLRCASA